MESPLNSLIELETWIIEILGYIKSNLQRHITQLVMLIMIALL